jgi:multiple sugar transport system ATP-binding protein
MMIGQRVAVMREGAVQQIGTPLELYQQPVNMFVAGFIGSPPMNLLRGRIVPSGGEFVFQENNPAGVARGARLELPLSRERGERLSRFAEGNMVLGVRPEYIRLYDGPASDHIARISIELVEPMGIETHVHFSTGAHTFIARMSSGLGLKPGDRVPLSVDLTKAFFFNPVSEAPIG